MSDEKMNSVLEQYEDVKIKKEPKKRKHPSERKGYLFAKRTFDIVFSFIGLLILFPIILVLALLVRLGTPGPSFYLHERNGLNRKPFKLYKLRSMYKNADEIAKGFTEAQIKEWDAQRKVKDDPRVTPFGRFLRNTSLDELPQLLNILKGELSFVGPRPIPDKELNEKYSSEEDKAKLLSVKPGLTGYWQAYARSSCTYEKRIEMELYYVDHASFWWDIKIIFVTFISVFKGEGTK